MSKSPTKRSLSDNLKLSPNKTSKTRKEVAVRAGVVGNSTTGIVSPLSPDGINEPFTHPAREAIADSSRNMLTLAGFVFHAAAVTDPAKDIPRLSSRGYPMKVFVANTDMDLTVSENLKQLAQTFCDVSTVKYVFPLINDFSNYSPTVHEQSREEPLRVLPSCDQLGTNPQRSNPAHQTHHRR